MHTFNVPALCRARFLKRAKNTRINSLRLREGLVGGKRACIGGCEIRRDARADTLPPATLCKIAAGVCVPRRDSFFAVSMRWWTT